MSRTRPFGTASRAVEDLERTSAPSRRDRGLVGVGARLIEQLNDGHRRCVSSPIAHLENPKVTAGSLLIPRAELGEELADRDVVAQAIEREPAAANGVLARAVCV